MKKYTGNYTSEAGKALKSSDRIFCHVSDDAIYLSNGYLVYKMDPLEYAAIVQPVTHCEPGNWTIDNTGKHDGSSPDLVKFFRGAVLEADAAGTLERCPLDLDTGNTLARSYYNAEKDFAAFFNGKYMAAICSGVTLRCPGPLSAVVAYAGEEAIAMVMPVKPDAKSACAVKAYFAQPDSTSKTNEANKLTQAQNEITALREQLAQQAAELEALHNAQQPAPTAPADNKPEPKTAAELIAARWAGVVGLTATIKGAQTATPVIWLSGETSKHAKTIEAEGGKWSNKKSAYYFRVA